MNVFGIDLNAPESVIDVAYVLLENMSSRLMESGYTVLVEGTFTLVNPTGAGEFHQARIERLMRLADSCQVKALVVVLDAPWATVSARIGSRMNRGIVEAIWQIYRQPILLDAQRIDVSSLDPPQVARILRGLIDL